MGRLLRGVVEAALRVPVFVKIMGIAIGLMLLVAGAVSWQINRTWNRLLLEDVDAQARIAGLAYILVLDARGALVAATLPERSAAGLLAANSAAAGQAPRSVRLDGRGGVVRVGLAEEPSRHEIEALARRLIAVTLVITAIGALAAWGLTWIITRPLHEMVQLTGAVREGRYDQRVPVWSADELGTLATAFNDMSRALGEKERVRQELLRGVIARAKTNASASPATCTTTPGRCWSRSSPASARPRRSRATTPAERGSPICATSPPARSRASTTSP
jgi:methyl-accepting chemotaxis protein